MKEKGFDDQRFNPISLERFKNLEIKGSEKDFKHFHDIFVEVKGCYLKSDEELIGTFKCKISDEEIFFRFPNYESSSMTINKGDVLEVRSAQKSVVEKGASREQEILAVLQEDFTEINLHYKNRNQKDKPNVPEPVNCENCGNNLSESDIKTGGSPELGWEFVKCSECGEKYSKDYF